MAPSRNFDKKLVEEQEVLNNLSEMMMETYVAESLALRVQKIEGMKGAAAAGVYRDILDVYVYDAADMVRKEAVMPFIPLPAAEEAPPC